LVPEKKSWIKKLFFDFDFLSERRISFLSLYKMAMTTKKAKKYGDIRIPTQSLLPADKDGFLTKQGGSIKTWKRRYFILKSKSLYYYKTPKDAVITGRIDLEPNSIVREETKKAKPGMFSVNTSKRVFYMYPDRPEEMREWIDAINRGIENAKSNPTSIPGPSQYVDNNNVPSQYFQSSNNTGYSGSGTTGNAVSPPSGNPSPPSSSISNGMGSGASAPFTSKEPSSPLSNGRVDVKNLSPRDRLTVAKGVVPFLKDEDSKVLEFWEIWSQSIPPRTELSQGLSIEFLVSISADMQKLTWRTHGPQNLFIQRMVDFFWNVGAPELEIDRLNDVGALINPVKIGSWIDMSAKGGMDGGWYFPVDVPMKLALEAADPGDASRKVGEWCENHGIGTVYVVGRDMGAAPPRQTEFRIRIPGTSLAEQLRLALNALEVFSFPAFPEEAVQVLEDAAANKELGDPLSTSVVLSVITSSDGFVRIGVFFPKPTPDLIGTFCRLAGGSLDSFAPFEASILASSSRPAGTSGPAFVECQHLMKGFGYGVYKEGFDVVFHYNVGSEEHE